MSIPAWLEAASAAGQAAGGVATVVGLWFAIRSVDRWRTDRLDERRADAAARAYLALVRACDLLVMWADGCSAYLLSHRSDRPFAGEDFSLYRAHNERGREAAAEALSELRRVSERSAVYLDADELKLLAEIEPLWEAIRTDAGPIGATDRQLSDKMIDRMCERFETNVARARALLDRGAALRDVGRFLAAGRRSEAVATRGEE